ncbi:MAG: sodium:solute symporter family protein [Clostridiales bacterium]|nr:sodium:solute symporter family protein [Clostridiales bacterium]
MINALIIGGVYLIVLFVLSAFLIRKALTSFEDYSYCGRSLGIGFIFFTYLGTWIGGGTIIGLVGRSHDFGASQYWIMAMSCFVELFFAFFLIDKIRDREYKSITGFFASNYPMHDGVIRIPAAAALLIRNVTMIAMQFSALSYLITITFGINRSLALMIIFIVIIAYTVLSGLWGVAMTDVFQGILQTFSIIALIVVTLYAAGGIGSVEHFYLEEEEMDSLNLFSTTMSWYEIIMFIAAFGLFFLMNDQTNWERIYASKGKRTAKWGFMLPLVITLISLVLISYLGVFQRVISGGVEDSQSVLYTFLFARGGSVLTILIMVGLIAAIMSSADSFLLASGIMISEDIIKKFIIKDLSDRAMIFFTRIFVVVTGSIAFTFAININDILSLWLTGIGMTSMILLPGYFLGWSRIKPATDTVLAGMGVGAVCVLLMILGIIPIEAPYICACCLLNLLVCVIPVKGNRIPYNA